jgi:hypothetical protein
MTRKPFVLSVCVLLACLAGGAAANPPPVEVPDLNYINVMHALIKLEKFKPDNQEYLEAYAMVAHCDIVKGSYRDEFRWKQAQDALKKWLELNRKTFSTRLAVRSQIMFDRYDFVSKNFLFAAETEIKKLNTFTTNSRPDKEEACNRRPQQLLPSRYRVVTNNPLTLPGLRLTEQQAEDLRQKFNLQKNPNGIAWVRFNIEILDAEYMGPTVFSGQAKGDFPWKVKATLHSVEFFSDPEYRNRFYYYLPL